MLGLDPDQVGRYGSFINAPVQQSDGLKKVAVILIDYAEILIT